MRLLQYYLVSGENFLITWAGTAVVITLHRIQHKHTSLAVSVQVRITMPEKDKYHQPIAFQCFPFMVFQTLFIVIFFHFKACE